MPVNLEIHRREKEDIVILDLKGRLIVGEPATRLRETINKEAAAGCNKIILNLEEVDYIDSTGLGELVSGYRLVKSEGGEIKLLNLNKKVTDLLQITKLYTVFDIHNQEAQAVSSFHS